MSTVEWTSSVGVVEENEVLSTLHVDNNTFNNIVAGKWIKEEVYEELKKHSFKLLLINEKGESSAIRTFGARFALFTGIIK